MQADLLMTRSAPARDRATASSGQTRAVARGTAEEFEAVFIAEMLSHAGYAKALTAQAGFGADAMSGFLLAELAQKIVARGGFGVADAIMDQLNREP